MQYFTDTIQDRNGNVIGAAKITITDYPSGTTSSVYATNAIGTITNPITVDSDGQYAFYAIPGSYTLTVSKSGIAQESKVVTLEPVNSTISVLDYGAVGNGIADDTTKIAAAIAAQTAGGSVYFPAGTYLISTRLDTDDAKPVKLYGDGVASVIKKGANIDMISLGKRSIMRDLYLNGNGGTYTGRGVIITTGSGGDPGHKRLIDNCFINDTESYGVEYTTANAGYASIISNSTIVPFTGSVAAVKCTVAGESNGNRTMSNVWSQSNPLIDVGASDNSTIVGCNGGAPILAGTSLKTVITGCRLVHAASTFTIDGDGTVITGNAINGSAITFASTVDRLRFSNNAIVAGSTTITDNAPGVSTDNYVDISSRSYTTTWSGGGVSVGNGTLTSLYERSGQKCFINIKLIGGTTTNWGGATAWAFSIPYTPYRDQIGTAMAFDSSTSTFYPCLVEIKSTVATIKLIGTTPVANYGNSTTPFTWATSDTLTIDLWYWIYNV